MPTAYKSKQEFLEDLERIVESYEAENPKERTPAPLKTAFQLVEERLSEKGRTFGDSLSPTNYMLYYIGQRIGKFVGEIKKGFLEGLWNASYKIGYKIGNLESRTKKGILVGGIAAALGLVIGVPFIFGSKEEGAESGDGELKHSLNGATGNGGSAVTNHAKPLEDTLKYTDQSPKVQPPQQKVDWSISPGRWNYNSSWDKQPVLTIDGERFTYDAPLGYIYKLEEIKNQTTSAEEKNKLNNLISGYQKMAVDASNWKSKQAPTRQQPTIENKVEATPNYQLGYHYDGVFYSKSLVGRESRTLEYFDSNTGKTKWRTTFPGNLWYWQDEGEKGVHVEIEAGGSGGKMVLFYVNKENGNIISRHEQ